MQVKFITILTIFLAVTPNTLALPAGGYPISEDSLSNTTLESRGVGAKIWNAVVKQVTGKPVGRGNLIAVGRLKAALISVPIAMLATASLGVGGYFGTTAWKTNEGGEKSCLPDIGYGALIDCN